MKKLVIILSVLILATAGANAIVVQPVYSVKDTIAPAQQTTATSVVADDDPQQQAHGKAKNQTVALILAVIGLFGIAGLHRFYLGYTGIGIIQLLTGGLFGIWTIIDIIRILSGDLQPKDGYYAETL